jgi:hypothetical protein
MSQMRSIHEVYAISQRKLTLTKNISILSNATRIKQDYPGYYEIFLPNHSSLTHVLTKFDRHKTFFPLILEFFLEKILKGNF